MKFLRSRFFLICVCILLVVVLVPSAFIAFGQTDLLHSALVTVSTPFSYCGAYVADAVNGFTDIFTDYDRLKEENAALRAELEALRTAEHDRDVVQNENEWLKEYLNFHNEHPSYRLTDARVVGREANNYASVFTLDCGSVHGIKTHMPVLCDGALFGYVSEVGLDWCRVVTVIETSSSVGVRTERGGADGMAEGDPDLRAEGTCRMTYIDAEADIRIGDLVYTKGGAESLYPAGLLLGTVSDIRADEATRTLTATITPTVDFSDLSHVDRLMIVCGYEGGAS